MCQTRSDATTPAGSRGRRPVPITTLRVRTVLGAVRPSLGAMTTSRWSTTPSRTTGGTPTAASVLQGDDADLSDREATLARWARQVLHDPNATTESDVDRLRQAGLGDREILEATAWVAFRLAFSTVNDALGALPDAQLAEKASRPVRDAVTLRPAGLTFGSAGPFSGGMAQKRRATFGPDPVETAETRPRSMHCATFAPR